ncbi:MAG: molybdopterin cofactor-binding domain-containing protein [Alphaproteobacteria bacterium]
MKRTPLAKPERPRTSRRQFLKAGVAGAAAFMLAGHVSLGRRARAEHAPKGGTFDPNVFVKIDANDKVTVLIKHFEMGQGISTGLTSLVAEELDAAWSQMAFEFAPVNAAIYNNLIAGPYQVTGGSTSMANSWEQMRKVGAAARHMLVAAAAAQWRVPAAQITVSNGIVAHAASKRSARFGALAAAAQKLPVPRDVILKKPDEWKLIGTRLPRLDSEAKTDGTTVYSFDVRRPGMLTAVIRRPERFGATVAAFDATAAKQVPGVVDVVHIPMGVAVLAKDTWAALRGRDALKVQWHTDRAENRSSVEIFAEYRGLASGDGINVARRGDAAAGLRRAAKLVEAEFTFPFLAHAPMEPLNGVIELNPGGAEIWAGCQSHSIDQIAVASVLGLRPDQVKINTLMGGGSFGRRSVPVADWLVEMAVLAKVTGGKAPLHVIWTREDDIRGGFYRPMVLHRLKAGLDADGRIAGWQHKIVAKSITLGTPLEQIFITDGVDPSSIKGVSDSPYALTDFSVDLVNAKSPVPVLWWRSVAYSHTAQVMETMIDELAHLAGKDPVAFRLDLLAAHTRHAAVLKLAAEKAGWGRPVAAGRGRGVAVQESFDSYVAIVADIAVSKGDVKVERITAAVDCGIPVNPDVIVAQVEGAVGFALSAVLRNRITLTDGKVDQGNFDDYEPTRIYEMPAVDVHIVKSAADPTGISESAVPPLAPAIGNAIFAATGKRLRSLPFDLKSLV